MNEPDTVDRLFSTQTVRARSKWVLSLCENGKTNFKLNRNKMPEVVEFVKKVTLENFPTLQIPAHSRWAHFQAGGVDRMSALQSRLKNMDQEDRLRSLLDLVIVSVLLDAGAGMKWKYSENGKTYGRSEGLALASLEMFLKGRFSSNPHQPFQADAKGLQNLSIATLIEGFQVSDTNPLEGTEGRLQLMNSLGRALPRPSSIVDELKKNYPSKKLRAGDLLKTVLYSFGPIWPGRLTLDGVPLGDVWKYHGAYVPFHKLSQWMTYSLLEPFFTAGWRITDLDDLTGLPEYRNGGLLIDLGLLELRDASLAQKTHAANSDLIIEWRALTVALLDEVAEGVRKVLGKSRDELPLGSILEGGTWKAGRIVAQQKRPDSSPPLKIQSDGTVF